MSSLDSGHQHSYTAGAAITGQGGPDLHEHYTNWDTKTAEESGNGHTHRLIDGGEKSMVRLR